MKDKKKYIVINMSKKGLSIMFSKKFIKATKNYCEYHLPVNAPYVRKTFVLDKLPQKAKITLTSTGFYRLWVNGIEITEGLLAPYISNPDDLLFYDYYDVTQYLKTDKNSLALMLGNGMSNAMGGYIWDFDKASFRSAPKLALHFEAHFEDSSFSFEADDTFKCAPSPITFDDLRSGEHYDANLEIENWNLPDFDDSKWSPAIIAKSPLGKALPNDTDKIVITKELKAIKVYKGHIAPHKYPDRIAKASQELSKTTFYKPSKNESGYIFEFSENASFLPKLRIKGKKGQKIILQCSEYCGPNGEMSYENLTRFFPEGFCQRDIYTCKGEGLEEYIPSFTYHGARYIMVIGADEYQISEDLVTMLVMNSDLKEAGDFDSSDEIANKLQRNARISDLANFVYFPTDCPHREKNGWTGDAAVSAEHMLQNLDVERSFTQWLKMVCASQREDGALPGIVPTSGWGFAWGNGPVWDQVIIELPYQTYIYRGNTEMFLMCSDTIMRYLNYISKKRDERGLIDIGLGDWCHTLRWDADNHLCPIEVSDTITTYATCKKAEFLFGVTGLKAQEEFARALADELYESIRKYLVDLNTMTVKGACQTSQAMGIYYDIFEPSEKSQAYTRLLEFIHEKDDHMDGGIIGLRTIFRTLANFGDAELAYKMITRTDAPSYGVWVTSFDLVSMAEAFESTVNGYQRSLNHHFMSDISGFFISHIVGISVNPYKEDPSFVKVQPNFIKTLDYAKGYYDTIAGKINVRWERKQNSISLYIDKADDVKGEIHLPKGYVFTDLNGQKTEWMRERKIYSLENGVFGIKSIV